MRPNNLNCGRKPFVPTAEQRSEVRALASCGTPQDVIARYVRISRPTLRLHFHDELDFAAIKANQAMAKNLFRIGAQGNGTAAVSAIKYWLNSRAKDLWGESASRDVTETGGGLSGLLRRIRAAKQNKEAEPDGETELGFGARRS